MSGAEERLSKLGPGCEATIVGIDDGDAIGRRLLDPEYPVGNL